jgi:preprotein translocase subunit SecD
MNDNEPRVVGASDEQILDGIRGRLSAVEPLVPRPSTLQPDPQSRSARVQEGRMVVRVRPASKFGVGAVLAIVLVVVVVGAGFTHQGLFGIGGPNPGNATLAISGGDTINYTLVAADGGQPTADQLAKAAGILQGRVESAGVQGFQITTEPPNTVTIRTAGHVANFDALVTYLGKTGQLDFVLLPPSIYGSESAAGTKPVPTAGDTIDPTLPVQFTGTQLVSQEVMPLGEADRGWSISVAFDGSATSDFATFSRGHVGNYVAVVLDRKVLAVPVLMAPILDGRVTIAGAFTDESMPIIVGIFKYGALPGTLSLVSYDRSGYHPIPSPTPSGSASAS